MTSRLVSGGRAAGIVGVAMACLVSCTPGASPRGHAVLPHPVTVSARQRSPAAQSWVARCLARKVPGSRAVPFRGSVTPTHYCAVVWSSDVVHGCRRLAYGAQVIAFVRRHPCRAVHRVLATVYVGSFSVNVSSVVTSFAGTPQNPYGAEYRFGQLASSRRAGGIADLLRDGHRIPGPRGRPPANAHYGVYPFNTGADILYTWYRNPPASPVSWKTLDQDLSFSRLTG